MSQGKSKPPKALPRLLIDTYRYFRFRYSACRGVYESFEQAQAAVPRRTKIGYNHKELAKDYLDNFNLSIFSTDYPILYHLDPIVREFPEHWTLLDFGGNLGGHYFRLKRYVNLERVKWVVCDVPAITKVARESCSGVPNIQFIDDLAEFEEQSVDVLLASGSMQYLSSPSILLSKLLDGGLQPQHILIDDVPVHQGSRFVTLQNGGLVWYPQYVFNQQAFIKDIADFGYKLIDSWNHNKPYVIPFHTEKIIQCEGYYFAR